MTNANHEAILIAYDAAAAAASEHYRQSRAEVHVRYHDTVKTLEQNLASARAGADARKARLLRDSHDTYQEVEIPAQIILDETILEPVKLRGAQLQEANQKYEAALKQLNLAEADDKLTQPQRDANYLAKLQCTKDYEVESKAARDSFEIVWSNAQAVFQASTEQAKAVHKKATTRILAEHASSNEAALIKFNQEKEKASEDAQRAITNLRIECDNDLKARLSHWNALQQCHTDTLAGLKWLANRYS